MCVCGGGGGGVQVLGVGVLAAYRSPGSRDVPYLPQPLSDKTAGAKVQTV